ncbi:hypothetical protein ACTSKR_12775 [Chitinibacteraceae bacterium HSL-7]
MLIPEYWAECRRTQKYGQRQLTVRRFGWSTHSYAEAQTMADERVADAIGRLIAGEDVPRLERKTAYGNADGTPIREQVLSRHGQEVITRNAYGAHCLNTPRALFADVDYPATSMLKPGYALPVFGVLAALSVVVSITQQEMWFLLPFLLGSLILSLPIGHWLGRLRPPAVITPEVAARERVAAFVATHPDWGIRVYRSPSGLRLLATHRPFSTDEADVASFFEAVGTDPLYAQLCHNQRCFRARLTGKPWRMGLHENPRKSLGIWPVPFAQEARRREWIGRYEAMVPNFAACQYIETLGVARAHPDISAVVELHDRLCRARESNVPLA